MCSTAIALPLKAVPTPGRRVGRARGKQSPGSQLIDSTGPRGGIQATRGRRVHLGCASRKWVGKSGLRGSLAWWSEIRTSTALPNTRTVPMLNTPATPPKVTSNDREARIQALLQQLRPNAEDVLRRMAELLVDLPDDKAFGQIEYELRDLAHDLAAASHQAGLTAGKKRATRAPASSVPTASTTPASSGTAPRPG